MLVACFYMPQIGIAVERARLPHLWGQPVALQNEEGILAAVSEETQPYGIRVGQQAAGARALCENLILLPYDRPAYELAAHPIWDLFAIESSVVEPVSPELCYVELTGPDMIERAAKLASTLSTHARFPVHAGLARTRFVARQAAIRSRESPGPETDPNPRFISSGREAGFLAKIPISEAPGLDYAARRRLERLGVRTFGDVLKLPRRELMRQLKELGFLLHRLADGEDGERVRPLWPPRGIERTLSFEEETADSRMVEEALRRCAESLAGALARNREYGRSITLRVKLADGSWLRESEKLAMPLNLAPGIHRAALRLLKRMPIEQPLLEVNLRASDLGAGSGVQLALLDENRDAKGLPHERRRSLEAALQYLRKRYGVGAVLTASMLRQARRIGLWTYPLGHLLDEPVRVATNERGRPIRFWRRGRPRDVRLIQDRWREVEWFWGALLERTVYRVETDPAGLCELHQLNHQWRLTGMAD